MSKRRFHSPDLHVPHVDLDEAQSSHARRVLRLGVGDTVGLFDGAGTVATGRIAEARRTVRVEIMERHERPRPTPTIDLAVAVPKGGRADVLVEEASQLGADRLIPLISQRSVVQPKKGKLGRFERLAVESAKQCGRAWVMEVDPPTELRTLLKQSDHDVRLFADTQARPETAGHGADHPDETNPVEAARRAEHVLVLIGPEGGWTGKERRSASEAGCLSWRLGPNVMRVETAAAAALAILRHGS
jgi:16S rRNA (uracil1498-N3)-methyltransferase